MAADRRLKDSDEARLKHLEFIHNVIGRLAGNSFWLKGWSVTLVAAIFAVAARDGTGSFLWVALVPAFAFWGLDAFYRGQEHIFRDMHDEVISGEVDLMSMKTKKYEKGFPGWLWDLFSRSVWPFHLALVVVVVVVINRSGG